MPTIDVDPLSFMAATAAAPAGATIAMQPGDYPKVRLKTLAADIAFVSADPGKPARFTEGLTIDAWKGATFKGVAFDIAAATANYSSAVRIYGGEKLRFEDCDLSGLLTAKGERWGFGIDASKVNGIAIERCRGDMLWKGFRFGACTDLDFIENDVTRLGSDGFNGGQCERVRILRNVFEDFAPVGADHPDAIQFLTGATGAASAQIEIADNLIICGTAKRAQGIFIRTENAAVRHRDVTIKGNTLINVAWQGIGVTSTDSVVIDGNDLLFFAAGGLGDPTYSWIKATGSIGSVVNNRAMKFLDVPANAMAANTVTKASSQSEIDAAIGRWRATFRAKPPPVANVGTLVLDGKTYDVVLRA